MSRQTVREQLVYEILDPKNYITPDGTADFTTLQLEGAGQNRVRITNMTGKPRPDMLKVGIGYHGGFLFDIVQWFVWPDALEKARYAERNFYEWLKWADMKPIEADAQYAGINMCEGPTVPWPDEEYARDIPEIAVRFATKWNTREEAETFRKEFRRVIGCLPGSPFKQYALPAPTRITAYRPTLIPRSEVHTTLKIKEVR